MKPDGAGLFVALCLAASGCAAPPSMSRDEARDVLEDFTRGHAAEDVCTPEGQKRLRDATRAYSAAMHAEGKSWPDVSFITQTDSDPPGLSDVELMVAASVAAGFIKPSDLHGEARQISRVLSVAAFAQPGVGAKQRALREACVELFAFQQAVARYAMDARRMERAIARSEDGGAPNPEMRRRYAERMERGRRQLERLGEDLEEKLAGS